MKSIVFATIALLLATVGVAHADDLRVLVTRDLPGGWSSLSVPVEAGHQDVPIPGTRAVFRFDNAAHNWEVVEPVRPGVFRLEAGEGYLVRIGAEQHPVLGGRPALGRSIAIRHRYTAIAGLACSIRRDAIKDPEGLINGLWTYAADGSGRFVDADVLSPGHFYFLGSMSQGELTLSCDGSGAAEVHAR